jgi:hypothetical protein
MIFLKPLQPTEQPTPTIGKIISVVVDNEFPEMLEGTLTYVDSESCSFRLNSTKPLPNDLVGLPDSNSRIMILESEGEYKVPLSYLWAVSIFCYASA